MTPQQVLTVVLLLLQAGLPGYLEAQKSPDDLLQVVAELDEQVFGAFNDRDAERFLTFFSPDLEFYHDETGLTGFADLVESSERLFNLESPLRRTLVAGSLEIHPVPGYGAIQIGRHEFCHRENGVDDCGVFGFTHLWKRTEDGWRVTRVLSYGH